MFQVIKDSAYHVLLRDAVQGTRIGFAKTGHFEITTPTASIRTLVVEGDIRELSAQLTQYLTRGKAPIPDDVE